jgi:hypothetical protein
VLFWLCKQKGIKIPDLLLLTRADDQWRIWLFYYTLLFTKPKQHVIEIIYGRGKLVGDSNMMSFKRFESKPVVKIIYIYTHCNLWRHRQFIAIFYQFLHIRIEIIHGSHMYILFLLRVGLYVSFLPLANAGGKTSWHKGLPVVKTIYTYGFHELFLNFNMEGVSLLELLIWVHYKGMWIKNLPYTCMSY